MYDTLDRLIHYLCLLVTKKALKNYVTDFPNGRYDARRRISKVQNTTNIIENNDTGTIEFVF